MSNPDVVLDELHKKVKSLPGVLNVTLAPEIKDGVPTGKKALVVYVEKKRPCAELAPSEILPEEVDGIPVDVVEVSPQDFKVGQTSVTKKPPSIQKVLTNGAKNHE